MNSLIGHKVDKKAPTKPIKPAASGFLFNRFLVATPMLTGDAFERSVIFISAHDASGTLGLVINKEIKNTNSAEMLESMGVVLPKTFTNMPIYLGGPVDTQRGFVLHSVDYTVPSTIKYPNGVCLSTDRKLLQDYVDGKGPKYLMLVMGYCGWLASQVEAEYGAGAWLSLPATPQIIFGENNDGKWQKVAATNGIDINKIVPIMGNA